MHRLRFGLMVALVCAAQAVSAQTPGYVTLSDTHGWPRLEIGGTPWVESEPVFWAGNWRWMPVRAEAHAIDTGRYRLTGQVEGLSMSWAAQAEAGPDSVRYDIRLNATAAQPHVVAGLVFRNQVGLLGSALGQPVLLPGNTGWQWGQAGQAQVTIRFSPALPRVYFERGDPSEIRALFFDGPVPAGERRHTMTVSWSGDLSWRTTRKERLGGPSVNHWPLDASAHLAVPPSPAHTAAAGPSGTAPQPPSTTPVSTQRWWGTNLTSYALFQTPRDEVARQARRMAALGFNLVRLHHHDSPWVTPNVLMPGKAVSSSAALNPESMDKLDWWIQSLKNQGIAVWLDLHVQRALRPEDGVDGFEEITRGQGSADLKGFNYVNPSIRATMQAFNQAYLNHVNRYTGLAYKDDPAVVSVQITNENDLTQHFGNALLPDKGVAHHHRLYREAADAFASQHGLPRDRVWRSWEAGPSKLFLNDLEQRFNSSMLAQLRSLGMRASLSTTSSWGDNPLWSLPALTVGDLVDVHTYSGVGALEKNPAYAAHLGHWAAAAQVLGKPLTVSEWNADPFPLHDRHTLPLLMAAMASHQGWRGLMHYAYSQEAPQAHGSPSNWHSYNDPSLLPMLSAAALMYRRGDVREATTTYVFDPGAEVFFHQAISAGNAAALRSAAEKGKLLVAMPHTPTLPWLKRVEPPQGATIIKDPRQSLLPEGAQSVTSDTGELSRNWVKGIYTINTARTQAAMGWLGGEDIRLPGLRLALETRHASVALQSLDGTALGESRDLLLSIGTRSEPSPGNKTPFRVEPLAGDIRVKAPVGLKLYRSAPFNQAIEYPARYDNGDYLIRLEGKLPVAWLHLRAPP